MRMLILLLIFSSFCATRASTQSDSINIEKLLESFSKEEKTLLAQKKLVLRKEKIDGHVWPRLKIFSIVNSSPLTAMGIFAAYDYQKSYVPNVIKSDVTKQITSTNVLVNYELKMPWPLDNGIYTHGHYLKKFQDGYRLDWYLVESNSADFVKGFAIFIPYKKKTLMYYDSLVDPKSIFGGVLKKLMVKDVEKTIKAIIKEIENVELNSPSLKQKYSEKITKALAGKNAY